MYGRQWNERDLDRLGRGDGRRGDGAGNDDPDVFLHLWGFTPNYSMTETRETLETHDVGSQLSAVRNDRVHAAGMRYQGPVMNLFQLEMGAKQLYPDRFGEWPRYHDGEPYPEIPESEWLFDRREVAAIVNGEIES